MDKRQFLEQTIDRIRDLDLDLIIEKYVDLPKRVSGSYLGICPFHNDTRLGSFVVTPRKGIFKCFACDKGGDAIKFVSLHTGVNYVEAAFEIALQERIISQDEYEEYFQRKRYFKKDVEQIESIYTQIDKNKNKSNKASPQILDKVLTLFLDGLKVSEEHKEYLNVTRGLSDDIIEKREYRSYPTPGAMNNLIKSLEEKQDDIVLIQAAKKGREESCNQDMPFVDAVLFAIPGFFQRNKKGNWEWEFPNNKGLLLPIRNAINQIVGLQIRRDEKDEQRGRYFWFSSSFALYDDKSRYGTSSGSPLDVIYPEEEPNQILFITEGRFKSEIITEKLNSTSISVQGVSNWKGINIEIAKAEKEIMKKYPSFKGFSTVFVAFDSDMSYKYQVYDQLKKMSDFISSTKINNKLLSVGYVHWEGENKGIDDLLINKHFDNRQDYKNLFNIHNKDYWDTEYAKQLEAVRIKKKVNHVYELSQDDLKEGIHIGKKQKDIEKVS